LLKPSGPILHLSEGIGLPAVVGVFMCVKNITACSVMCLDVHFEMTAFEVKGMVANCTWEIYRIEKSNPLNTFYASLFSWELNNPQIQSIESGKLFTITINIMRKLISTTGKKRSVVNF
jgi:hypothetical protein